MGIATLCGGPYDGAGFNYVEPMPERIILETETHSFDASNPEVREAFAANLGEGFDAIKSVTNAQRYSLIYALKNDEEGTPYYRFAGWRVEGESS